MKKILIVMVVVCQFLFANTTSNIEAQYSEAMKFYKAQDFKSSYEILSKIYLSKLSDAKLSFYLGRSAYETGHYEVALAAFERVEMLDASNLRNRLEMARTYFMLKMYEESEMAFRDVLSNPNIPQNVRTNIELYLSKVTKVQEKSFTYASVNLDFLYDSNVNYGSLDDHYEINIGTITAEKEKDDIALQFYGDIVNIYDIGSKNGFAIKNRLKLFLKEYKELNDYDVQYLAYFPSLLYKETKYLSELVFGIDIMKLGSVEYLRTYSVSPRFEYSHTNRLKSVAHFKYLKKSFSQSAQEELDAAHYELAYTLQSILSPRSYVQINTKAIAERKDGGTRVDVDYKEYRVNLIYANQFNTTYATELFAQYRRRDYEDYSTLFSSTRADDAGSLSASFNAKVLQSLRIHLKGTYDRVESNQQRYSYQKHTITIGLNKTF